MRELIKKRITLAQNGFMTKGLSKVDTGLRMPFVVSLLPRPTIQHCQWDHGDGTSRALLAWLYLKDILGETPLNLKTEAGLWEHLKSLVVQQTGMVCVPEHSDISDGEYYYHMWDQGRYFDYLVQKYLHQTTPENLKSELANMITRLQQGVYSLAVKCGLPDGNIGLKWDADVYWNDSPGLPENKNFGKYNFTNWCIVSSQLIGPQTQWAKITGSDEDLEIAMQLAHGFFAGLESPRRESTSPLFTEAGEFRGHVHGTLAGLLGVVKLAKFLVQNNKESTLAEQWIDFASRVYNWLFDSQHNEQGISTCGCCPEGFQLPRYSSTSEMCCTVDMIELAAELAECASIYPKWSQMADLWDDIERFTRNEVLRNQFTDISKIEKLLPNFPNQSRQDSLKYLEQVMGTWVFGRTYLNELGVYCVNNDPDFQMPVSEASIFSQLPMLESGGCCAYSGIRGLYLPYMNAVVQNDTTTEIRISASHDDDNVLLELLSDGSIKFKTLRNCTLLFRKPLYTGKDAIQIKGCDAYDWSDDGRWVNLNLEAGQSGEIFWPETQWSVVELFGPPNELGLFSDRAKKERIKFKLSYERNVLTKVEPAGKILPFEKGL